jgi:hypothetical protein
LQQCVSLELKKGKNNNNKKERYICGLLYIYIYSKEDKQTRRLPLQKTVMNCHLQGENTHSEKTVASMKLQNK